MRGATGSSPHAFEARHRLSASIEDIYRRREQKSKAKNSEKPFHLSIQDRSSRCKLPLLRLVLLIVICGTFLTLLYSTEVYNSTIPSHSVPRSNFVNRWIWGGSDSRYESNLDIDWDDVIKVMRKMTDRNEYQEVGLLNFNTSEINQWNQINPEAMNVVLRLDYAAENVTWDSLYPEWIDEEEEDEIPVCPSLPKLKALARRLDLIAVKLPCRKELANWSRDVARLHLQLAAAGLAASSKGYRAVHLLFVTDCFPIPNLFKCKELVVREGNAWLYKPNLNVITEKVQLPVGSCELSLPFRGKGLVDSGNALREAYATILHSADVYVCGAIAAAQSIRMVGSTRDLVILVDETISGYHKSGLQAAGWIVKTIERIRNPKAEKDAYNEWNYSKFRLWQLTEYDKIIFIDADLLILRNIDTLFSMPEISATGNDATLFNSGVMVIEPSNCTFHLLMDHIHEIESYNGGDQGYLNEIFTWWHRIPRHMNFLKHFWEGDDEVVKQKKTHLFGADPPVLYVLHYLGLKPWLCFRDYDCNWNNAEIYQEFASDVAHANWWRVHDAMPVLQQQFCFLRTKQKAQLEWDRREAEKSNYTDGHWRIKIKDPRLKRCVDNICSWKGMLKHWGETNWTDDKLVNTIPPPAITATSL